MVDIEIAAKFLEKERLSLVIVKDGSILFTSNEKGIKPLYIALEELKSELEGSSVADRVTGKAASMLCVHAKIKQLKTKLISDNAVNILKDTNIIYEYDERTPFIKNRDKTGMCPVETISHEVNNIDELLKGISEFLEKIQKSSER
ncbi:DUF1893 domain-containing protein [Sedimentibacter sp. MB31-C6]|uniref:DUF1893 domain-containing protein n=1 Tax=Sedimentibacter sp. MB31-C6 TaxID=3109366 RepID=UPI002DDD08C9|nr:DUF1893 domain-containing protein [Sedimentibacter sp. MB36-C1]WSI05538.1 DUF1893 domain-containing protein [Sedimentibacter sp. MB36-C1]